MTGVGKGVRRVGAGLAATAMGLQLASAQPVPAAGGNEELRSVFQRLLLDPGDPALNLRYAALSAADGDYARAIATYERILLDDPDNAEARSALERLRQLAEPPATDIVMNMGAQFESNAPRQAPNFQSYSDAMATMTGVLRDERVVEGLRWRSFATVYGTAHNRYRAGDVDYVGGNSGPVLSVADGWSMRPAVGAAFAARDYETMFAEVSGVANFETRAAGPLEQVNLRVAAQDWTNRDPGRNAVIGEIGFAFRWRDVTMAGDRFGFDPVFTYNGAQTLDNRYSAVNLSFDYLAPISAMAPEAPGFLGASYLGLEFHAERDGYEAPDASIAPPAPHRRDWYLAPGVRLVTPSLLGLNENWTLRYLFEDNVSNEFINKYRNHAVGLFATWRL
jgi:hypothetical protein